MVWEDVHWIDPTTEELLDLVVSRVIDLPLLVVITFRPEYQAPWIGAAHVTSLMLSRLSRRMSERIMVSVALSDALPDGVIEDIMAEAEGVPLFIEELTKAVVEAGPCAPGPVGASATRIPATLKDSLTARLDRLGAAREVAQTAACIGRQFEFRLLQTVSPLSASELEEALGRLMAAGLAFGRGAAQDATYTFKHALVRDAAYESLLNSKRRQLHGLIAEALERELPDRVRAEPELMAHHLTEAGIAERAIEYWLRAGEQAIRRSANLEAISHLRRGLELVETLPDTTERARIELELQAPPWRGAHGQQGLVRVGHAEYVQPGARALSSGRCIEADRSRPLWPVELPACAGRT
jgi:predicted ATPase